MLSIRRGECKLKFRTEPQKETSSSPSVSVAMFVSGRILGHLLWVSWFGVGINEGKMTGEILPNA